jgi:DNA polymerase-4
MDAFFASVELLRYPELRGQAVVVGGGHRATPTVDENGTRHFVRLREYTGRGVVTTSTYEARKLGVFSAMGMMKAAQLAPDAILLPSNFDSYRHYSELFKDAVASVAPRIENRGIDEIYIDLTDVPGETRTLAQRIKRVVADATGLTCSIAVAPNKLLAKIGSELDKPDGLTILSMDDLEPRIWPLAAKKVNGIGPKANDRLAALGIHTVGDIAAADPAFLQEHFGLSYASWLTRISAGIDERARSPARRPSRGTCIRAATAPNYRSVSPRSACGSPRTSNGAISRPRASASRCASATSTRSRATTRWSAASPTAHRSGAPRPNA